MGAERARDNDLAVTDIEQDQYQDQDQEQVRDEQIDPEFHPRQRRKRRRPAEGKRRHRRVTRAQIAQGLGNNLDADNPEGGVELAEGVREPGAIPDPPLQQPAPLPPPPAQDNNARALRKKLRDLLKKDEKNGTWLQNLVLADTYVEEDDDETRKIVLKDQLRRSQYGNLADLYYDT